ncbi:hypothetical protein [Natrinema longum]|uniref:Uncharacterized protein n=1 Tax=Natrinema longum TaxID=370324 RepID=A0A8A2U9H5_9EURY|nr:hypothetical protein [Natrinema longum]MBZ6493365.1 hypothetical protein [Natrinema longum]QSW85287.1 hypothetical protein J0X27_00090 [Natrinema longum]
MGADRQWFSVELTATGDPDAVVTAVENGTDRVDYRATHNGTLAFFGIEYITEDVIDSLESVIDHVDRVALVHGYDTAGVVSASYYERERRRLVERERLDRETAMTLQEGFFDYFAAKYGIHAVV